MNVLPYNCFRNWYWLEAAQRLAHQPPPRRAASESCKIATISRAEGGRLHGRVRRRRLLAERGVIYHQFWVSFAKVSTSKYYDSSLFCQRSNMRYSSLCT